MEWIGLIVIVAFIFTIWEIVRKSSEKISSMSDKLDKQEAQIQKILDKLNKD